MKTDYNPKLSERTKKHSDMKIHGIVTDAGLIDVSTSEKATKRLATMAGYDKIGYRNANDYYAKITHKRVNGRWVTYQCHHKIDIIT